MNASLIGKLLMTAAVAAASLAGPAMKSEPIANAVLVRPAAAAAAPTAEDAAKKAAIVITKRDGLPVPAKAPAGVVVGFSVANGKSQYAYVTGADGKRRASVVWAVEIEPEWLRDWIEVVDEGASIIVPTGSGAKGAKRIRVSAAGALGDTVAMQELVVLVENLDGPQPEPKPEPKPEVPDAVASLTGNAKLAYLLVKSKVVLTAARKESAAKMGQNFADVADSITRNAAGIPGNEQFKDPAFIEAETLRRNKLAQGSDDAAWSDFFKVGLRDLLVKLDDAGQLKTPADYRVLWLDLAAAFAAAAK